jgi:hypothetical protein
MLKINLDNKLYNDYNLQDKHNFETGHILHLND